MHQRGAPELFDAGQIQRGRYAPEPGEDPNNRRMRKPVVRKTVDLAASTLQYLTQRQFTPSIYQRVERFLPPTSDVMPLIGSMFEIGKTQAGRTPAKGYTTKFITHSINKARTPILTATISPDTRRVATGASSGEITLWNGLTFNFETILGGHDDAIRSMTWGGGGLNAILASGDDSGVIKLWQTTMNNLTAFKAHKSSVRDLAFAPQSHAEMLASCSDDHTISIWNTETGKEIVGIQAHGWDVKSCHWHPYHSLLATGSKDSSVKLWDPRTGSELSVMHGHKNTVNKVRFNYLNGNWLASCGRDRMVKVWDLRTLRELSSHRENEKELLCLEWHPVYEELFTSGAFDGDIRHWIVGEPLHVAEIRQAHDKEVNDIAWHPHGHLLVSVSSDQLTRYWARNKPGDEMTDKYNVSSLSGASKAEAIMELVEAQRLNPTQQRANDARRFALEEQAMQMTQQAALAGANPRGANSLPLGFAHEGRERMQQRAQEPQVKKEQGEDRKPFQQQHQPPVSYQQQQVIDERARYEQSMKRQAPSHPPHNQPRPPHPQSYPPPAMPGQALQMPPSGPPAVPIQPHIHPSRLPPGAGLPPPPMPMQQQPMPPQTMPPQSMPPHAGYYPPPQNYGAPPQYQQPPPQHQPPPPQGPQLSTREQYERDLAARRQQQRR